MLKLLRTGLLLFGLQLVATVGHAEQVIDKTQSVAPLRSDSGSGLCGSVTHFATQPSPPSRREEAVALADKPTTDPSVLGRVTRLMDTLNLRNGLTGAQGDFAPPTFRDAFFPYSSDPTAVPVGDDRNLVGRLRGYFNVTAKLAGKTLSFAVNCDDFCSLRIGKTDVISAADVRTSPRVIRQVRFPDPGLYPVEIIHYQNAAASYLEWALAESATPECPSDQCSLPLTDQSYAGKFTIVPTTYLYSARLRASPSCHECSAAGLECAAGSFCGDGLCQSCNQPDHCGPTCAPCPASASFCNSSGRQCVECVADDQCPSGYTCDIPNGKCLAPQPCDIATPCSSAQVCDRCTKVCVNPGIPCIQDEMCRTGNRCILSTGECVPDCANSPTNLCCFHSACSMDAQCSASDSCDQDLHLCRALNLGGGCDGCALPGRPPQEALGRGLGLVVLLGLGALGWRARRRRGLSITRSASGSTSSATSLMKE